jgi:hypothetical protein
MSSTNHFKFGASGISSATRGGFSVGVKEGADYGPTSLTGFWNGITPPVGGYTIYVDKASQGPSIHVASNDAQCIGMLLAMGATGSTIGDVLAWVNNQSNMAILTAELTLGDLPGAGPSIVTSGLTLNLDAGNVSSYPGYGTTWNDLSGNGNNGTLINSPTYNSSNSGYLTFGGTNGNNGTFNSTDQYVQIASPTSIPLGNTARTISTWVRKLEVTNPYPYEIVGMGAWLSNNRSVFTLTVASNPLAPSLTTWGDDYSGPTGYISNNTWVNLSVTYNGNTSLIVYVNGTQVGTFTFSSQLDTVFGASGLTIGTWKDGQWNSFVGDISNVLIYNRTLSDVEILQNYNAIKSRFGL